MRFPFSKPERAAAPRGRCGVTGCYREPSNGGLCSHHARLMSAGAKALRQQREPEQPSTPAPATGFVIPDALRCAGGPEGSCRFAHTAGSDYCGHHMHGDATRWLP